MDWSWLWGAAAWGGVAALVLIVGNAAGWRWRDDMPPLVAYGVGTGILLSAGTAWALTGGAALAAWQVAVGYWAIAALGGAGTAAAWGYHALLATHDTLSVDAANATAGRRQP